MQGQTCGSGPCIWGHADSAVLPMVFKVPAGYRVRILRIRGDLIAWPKVMEGEAPVKRGAYAGVLLGFSTTIKEGSPVCPMVCAEGVPIYLQAGISDQPIRVPFDVDLREERTFLDADTLYLKLASFENTLGHSVHMECTYSLRIQFERVIE